MTRHFTPAELDRAIAAETLLSHVPTPRQALNALAIALYEHEINSILHMPDEDLEFSRLQQSDRDRLCRDAAWLLGRMALNGYLAVYDRFRDRRKVTG